jgi:DNA-binding CsgD family transcriptional regulator
MPTQASANSATSISQVSKAIRTNLLLIVGGVLWWGCQNLIVFNAGSLSQGFLGGIPNPVWAATVATPIVVVGGIAFFARKGFSAAKTRWTYLLVFALIAVSMLRYPFPTWASTLLGALFVGGATGLGHAVNAELHVGTGSSAIPLFCALEIAGGAALYALGQLLMPVASLTATIALALGSCILLFLFSRQTKNLSNEVSAHVAIDATPLQITLLAFLVGLTYGIIVLIQTTIDVEMTISALPYQALGSLFAALLLIVVYFMQTKRTLLEQCFIIVVPFVVAGMLLMPLYPLNGSIPAVVHGAGYICFFLLLWHYAAIIGGAQHQQSSFALVTRFLCAILLGQFLGALFPAGLASYITSELIFALLLFLVIAFARQRKRFQGVEQLGTGTRIDAFAANFALTPRETEVLRLLMERTPYKQIEDKLCISSNTVKTHVKNIYQKTDVTSREELLKKLDTR